MAITYASRRLRIERQALGAFNAQQRQIAQDIGRLVLSAATARDEAGDRVIPQGTITKGQLQDRIWALVLKPYFIGAGDQPLGPNGEPFSPYTELIVGGIRQVTRNAVDQTVAAARRMATPTVWAWLNGPRTIQPIREVRGLYEPYHLFVDPNGYRLSDRVWQASIQTRAAINRLLDYHIAAGTAAVSIAAQVEGFLVPGQSLIETRRPYGRVGNYAARRLARTEITAAAGRGVVDSAAANPYVAGILWRLSGSHPRYDICDELARGGPDRNGIYAKDAVPSYPPHPHCLCSLLPVATPQPAALNAELEGEIERRTIYAQRLRGVLNEQWLVSAILGGFLDEALEFAA